MRRYRRWAPYQPSGWANHHTVPGRARNRRTGHGTRAQPTWPPGARIPLMVMKPHHDHPARPCCSTQSYIAAWFLPGGPGIEQKGPA